MFLPVLLRLPSSGNKFDHAGLTVSPRALYKKQLPRARSSMDRAPDYGSGGYRFKSCRARHRIKYFLFQPDHQTH